MRFLVFALSKPFVAASAAALTAALTATLFAIVLAASSPASAQTHEGFSVPANQSTVFGVNRLTSGGGCRGAGLPRLHVAKAPRHGEVRFERRRTPYPADHPRCAGQSVLGMAIIYTPERGYRGPDSFTVRTRASRNANVRITGRRPVTYDFTVR